MTLHFGQRRLTDALTFMMFFSLFFVLLATKSLTLPQADLPL
jgi:hypothetical protein